MFQDIIDAPAFYFTVARDSLTDVGSALLFNSAFTHDFFKRDDTVEGFCFISELIFTIAASSPTVVMCR